MKIALHLSLLFMVLAQASCQIDKKGGTNNEKIVIDINSARNAGRQDSASLAAEEIFFQKPSVKYSWLKDYAPQNSLVNQVAPPKGFERVAVSKGSMAEWLRFLPLAPKGTAVRYYNGETKPYQAGAYRVVQIDIGNRDLQQCADAVMRLKAEYHYSINDYANISFDYTSGDRVAFYDWANGRKPIIKGNKVYFSSTNVDPDYSYSNFKKYMRSIYMYAGTASLEKQMSPQSIKDIKAGDVFIKGGFPGHAVIVMDIAEKNAHKVFLIAQSYMPAQSIHILNNLNDESLSPWYDSNIGAELITPEWTFAGNALRTFDHKP